MASAIPLPESPPPSPEPVRSAEAPLPPLSRSGSQRSSSLSLDQRVQNMHDGHPAHLDPETGKLVLSLDQLKASPLRQSIGELSSKQATRRDSLPKAHGSLGSQKLSDQRRGSKEIEKKASSVPKPQPIPHQKRQSSNSSTSHVPRPQVKPARPKLL